MDFMGQVGSQDVVKPSNGPPLNTVMRGSVPLVNTLNIKSSRNLL